MDLDRIVVVLTKQILFVYKKYHVQTKNSTSIIVNGYCKEFYIEEQRFKALLSHNENLYNPLSVSLLYRDYYTTGIWSLYAHATKILRANATLRYI